MKEIIVDSSILEDGVSISVDGTRYPIRFPKMVWEALPDQVRKALNENLAFATTHFLPLILKRPIRYLTRKPLFEPHLFENQMYDLLSCEELDNKPNLSYLRDFNNARYTFENGESALPLGASYEPTSAAILPFTFGKESMLTYALSKDLGMDPVPVYCQEPSHPYEEEFKLKLLKRFEKEEKIKAHFITNGTGLFRYGRAFGLESTEIGWGSQTTILALMMLPFAHYYKAKYILFGNECSCNETKKKDGWIFFPNGYDQTSEWVPHQSNMVRIMTGDSCRVRSMLEPLEEINIFYILHKRYPQLGKMQFSCSGEKPLYGDTQWCHSCYKCARMYLFAQACGVDPNAIGFRQDLLNKTGMFDHYFGEAKKTGSSDELDFAFHVLSRKGHDSAYVREFREEMLPRIKPFEHYLEVFFRLKESGNLPEEFRQKLMAIFLEELENMKGITR